MLPHIAQVLPRQRFPEIRWNLQLFCKLLFGHVCPQHHIFNQLFHIHNRRNQAGTINQRSIQRGQREKRADAVRYQCETIAVLPLLGEKLREFFLGLPRGLCVVIKADHFTVRNIAAGSFSKHYGVEEGVVFEQPTIEFSYKNDELGDPLLNTYHALALKLATPEEIKTIEDYSFRINDALKAFWLTCGVTLVDFKLEFGRLSDGTIVLADEISPDTSRLWDSKTHEKLDKDRFRRDMGGVEEAYAEIMKRLEEHLK